MSPVVQLEQVGRCFGAVQALKDLSLGLEQGEVLGLLGHNGAGKSTLMKLVLGILAPSSGRVAVLGQDPRGRHARNLRLKLGYLPENVSFYDNLSGREVLHYFSRLKRVPVAEADRVLERVGLAQASRRRIRTYSKGMRQRLGLAQALLGAPQLLLLDEPTVGLDPMVVRDVYGMIDELRAAGTSVILSSHVLPGVERHIDRVAILCEGRLLALGSIDALREAAGLPLRIQARGEQLSDALRQRLAEQGAQVVGNGDGRLHLSTRPDAKLAVLRTLLEDERLRDVSLEPPSLDALYAHFDAVGRAGDRVDA
ncbi:ABC transporter ATP-binding protein [Thioalkalivibrio sulfidiphilus]|uniref:ABC transporter ATP-binding protein n=1 Tax=Thioalkalivibrio sulfidiphilus TaxID=1033854 RepID=UPI003B345548